MRQVLMWPFAFGFCHQIPIGTPYINQHPRIPPQSFHYTRWLATISLSTTSQSWAMSPDWNSRSPNINDVWIDNTPHTTLLRQPSWIPGVEIRILRSVFLGPQAPSFWCVYLAKLYVRAAWFHKRILIWSFVSMRGVPWKEGEQR